MKASTRFAIVGANMFLCVAGILVARSGSEKIAGDGLNAESADTTGSAEDYQFAASRAPELSFQQLEVIIRRDPVAKLQRGRLEFGSVRMEEGSALAEVLFVGNDGRVQPFLYKLLPERHSWKIVNVQRMWYVPRSHLLRGVRA